MCSALLHWCCCPQLRIRFEQPDLRIPNKGTSHGTALAAELVLLRKELAAKPSASVTVTDTCGTDCIDDEVELYYKRTLKDPEPKVGDQQQQQEQQEQQEQQQEQEQAGEADG
jgi:hypothetical protein